MIKPNPIIFKPNVSNPRALIIVLHGDTQSGGLIQQLTRFDDIATDLGCLAVYPSTEFHTWQFARRPGLNDDLAGLFSIVQKYGADLPLIMVGFSAGACFVDWLSAYPQSTPRILAAVAYSGYFAHGLEPDVAGARPTLLVSNTADHLVTEPHDIATFDLYNAAKYPVKAIQSSAGSPDWILDHSIPFATRWAAKKGHFWDVALNPQITAYLQTILAGKAA